MLPHTWGTWRYPRCMKIAARCTLILLTLVSPLHADRIVVDSSGGGDFLDIQPAINSALDGDVIEVRSGSYGPVLIVDKDLVLAAGSGASAVGIHGTVRVAALSAGKSVVLSGLTNLASNNLPDDGLLISNCDGSVRVQDCAFTGYGGGPVHAVGCRIMGSLNVEMSSVAFRGSDSNPTYQGGTGVNVVHSRLTLTEGYITGGRGGTGSNHPTMGCNGAIGGSALLVQASDVLLRGGSITPGLGGDPSMASCTSGPDGHGIKDVGGSLVQYLGTTIAGAQSGTIQQLPGVPRIWQGLTVFVNANAPFPVSISGEPGDRVVMLSSLAGQYRVLAGLGGNLAVRAPYQGQFLGVCDAFGSLQTAALYLVPGGGQSEHIFVQTLHFPSGLPGRALGNARVILAQ